VFYAAAPPDDITRDSGLLAPASGHGQRPVVVLMPGMSVPCSSYDWLARHLVDAGFVAVCYDHIESPIPGFEGLGPGLDIEPLKAEAEPGPCSTVLGPILDALNLLNTTSLPGCIDTDQVVLFGHSAGGTAALFSAGWFDGIRGVVTYGAHAGVSTLLGHPAGTVLPIHEPPPTLLIGGDADGVVAESGNRYGTMSGPTGLLKRTYQEALSGTGHGLVVLKDGQHLAPCYPHNPTLGRGFLESTSTDDPDIRTTIADLLVAFAQRTTSQTDTLESTLQQHATTITHTELI